MYYCQNVKKDGQLFQEAIDEISRKFFGIESKSSIPDFNEHNLRLLEQIFSTAVFQAPLCRDLDLMVRLIFHFLEYFKNLIYYIILFNL